LVHVESSGGGKDNRDRVQGKGGTSADSAGGPIGGPISNCEVGSASTATIGQKNVTAPAGDKLHEPMPVSFAAQRVQF
jgi:hypothetical protein